MAAAQLTTLTQINVAVARICLGTFSLRSGLGFSQSRFGVRDEGGLGPTPLTSSLTEGAVAVGGLFHLECRLSRALARRGW